MALVAGRALWHGNTNPCAPHRLGTRLRMTNTLAIGLFVLVAAFIGYDLYSGGEMIVDLGRRFTDLVQYIAFWR